MLAAFFDGEIRGVGEPLFFPATGTWFLATMLYSNESSGDTLEFEFYDSSSNQIIDAISLDDVPLWHIQGFNTIRNLYSCNQDFPILDNGECILDCIGDPSLDGQINIHDILMIVDLIIDCDSPFYCFDDNIECMDMNEDNIIDI